MQNRKVLEIGQIALCSSLGEKAQKVRVINRIGNYAILENGIRFHVLDDRKGQGIWYLPSHQMTISDPSQNY